MALGTVNARLVNSFTPKTLPCPPPAPSLFYSGRGSNLNPRAAAQVAPATPNLKSPGARSLVKIVVLLQAELMARVYVGNLDPRVTAREIEDEFRTFGVLRSVWVARKPPGFAFIDFDDRRDAQDAIRELDGKNGWKVELSTKAGGGRGRDRNGSDMKCYECGESGHFARECRLRIGSGGLGSGRRRSRSPRYRSRSRSRSPRYRRSPSYGRRSYSPRDRSPRRRSYSRSPPGSRARSLSRSPPLPPPPPRNNSRSPRGAREMSRSPPPPPPRNNSRSPPGARDVSRSPPPPPDARRSYSRSPGQQPQRDESPYANDA
ncbi:hypothetical protein SORBI_3004G211400 [Sorghum bicolor]|uniref:Uncharacterized protein n=3 Tax=Sorghum bicolor TaxID=4558 RepID=A0A1Z5RP12_SORBI|nr:hypothetical protein SORBI_3004G211400 [Sorghum bicolor]